MDYYLNKLTGSVPTQICDISALDRFYIFSNPSVTCYADCLTSVPYLTVGSVPACDGPTGQPTCVPSGEPTGQPSRMPTAPTGQPTCVPSGQPTCVPSSQPSVPTGQPTGVPTCQPSSMPSRIYPFYPSDTELDLGVESPTLRTSVDDVGVPLELNITFRLTREWNEHEIILIDLPRFTRTLTYTHVGRDIIGANVSFGGIMVSPSNRFQAAWVRCKVLFSMEI